jgi:hypothetical protein
MSDSENKRNTSYITPNPFTVVLGALTFGAYNDYLKYSFEKQLYTGEYLKTTNHTTFKIK